MEKTVRSFLESLKLGRRQSHENLTIFPLMAPQNGAPDYLTLEEALAEGCMRITELSEGGSVPELRLFNDSPRAVLIVEGEELSGAKQNRVVNATFLVPGKTQLVIPVSCVEQGRWSYKGRTFHSGGKVMHASLRRAHQRAVGERIWHESQRADRAPDGGLILTFQVAGLEEIKRWVLSLGPEAEVLHPEELRQILRDELTRTAPSYGLILGPLAEVPAGEPLVRKQ